MSRSLLLLLAAFFLLTLPAATPLLAQQLDPAAALQEAVDRWGDLAGQVTLGSVTSDPAGDGSLLSADATVFGQSARIEATTEGASVRSLVLSFPSGAGVGVADLRTLAGTDLTSWLPSGLSGSASLDRIEVDLQGTSVEASRMVLAAGTWAPLGADVLELSDVEAVFGVADPTGTRSVEGEVHGRVELPPELTRYLGMGGPELTVAGALRPDGAGVTLSAVLGSQIHLDPQGQVVLRDAHLEVAAVPSRPGLALGGTMDLRAGGMPLTLQADVAIDLGGAIFAQGHMETPIQNAFGMEGLDVGPLGVGFGVNFARPIPLPILAIQGGIRVADRFDGAVTLGLDPATPTNSMLDAELGELGLSDIVAGFTPGGVPNGIRGVLESIWVEDVRLTVVPPGPGVELFGQYYAPGFLAQGAVQLVDFRGELLMSIEPGSGVEARAAIGPIQYPGITITSADDPNVGPYVYVLAKSGQGGAAVAVSGAVDILGMRQRSDLYFSDGGFSATMQGDLLGAVGATLDVAGTDLFGGGDIYARAELETAFLDQVGRGASRQIDQAVNHLSREVLAALNTAEADLARYEPRLRDLDEPGGLIDQMRDRVRAENQRNCDAINARANATRDRVTGRRRELEAERRRLQGAAERIPLELPPLWARILVARIDPLTSSAEVRRLEAQHAAKADSVGRIIVNGLNTIGNELDGLGGEIDDLAGDACDGVTGSDLIDLDPRIVDLVAERDRTIVLIDAARLALDAGRGLGTGALAAAGWLASNANPLALVQLRSASVAGCLSSINGGRVTMDIEGSFAGSPIGGSLTVDLRDIDQAVQVLANQLMESNAVSSRVSGGNGGCTRPDVPRPSIAGGISSRVASLSGRPSSLGVRPTTEERPTWAASPSFGGVTAERVAAAANPRLGPAPGADVTTREEWQRELSERRVALSQTRPTPGGRPARPVQPPPPPEPTDGACAVAVGRWQVLRGPEITLDPSGSWSDSNAQRGEWRCDDASRGFVTVLHSGQERLWEVDLTYRQLKDRGTRADWVAVPASGASGPTALFGSGRALVSAERCCGRGQVTLAAVGRSNLHVLEDLDYAMGTEFLTFEGVAGGEDIRRASLHIRPGVFFDEGRAQGVTIRSARSPDHLLGYQGRNAVMMPFDPYDRELMRIQTFYPRPGLAGQGVSFESAYRDGIFLYMSTEQDPKLLAGFIEDSEGARLRATFDVAVDPTAPQPPGLYTPPDVVEIPAGRFLMGSPAGEEGRGDDEGPQHEVRLESFSMGRHEVTVAEFLAYVASVGLEWGTNSSGPRDAHPATGVRWVEAQGYVDWLSTQTGDHYRLPTEAEWEYGARAGTSTPRYWGDDVAGGEACRYASVDEANFPCDDGHDLLAPVGSFEGNPWGLHDMLGNAMEWGSDCFIRGSSYEGAPSDGSAWMGSEPCDLRVVRGGSFVRSTPELLRASNRGGMEPSVRAVFVGFRVVLDPRGPRVTGAGTTEPPPTTSRPPALRNQPSTQPDRRPQPRPAQPPAAQPTPTPAASVLPATAEGARDWTIEDAGDVNGDGTSDIVWRNSAGQVHFWAISNGARSGGASVYDPMSSAWRVVGVGDLDGDRTDDIVWRHDSGQVHYWPMSGGSRTNGVDISAPVGGDWTVVGVGDVDGNGTDDVVWQHDSGQVHYWPMDGGRRIDGVNISTPVGREWRPVGVGDLNGDGTDDIVWRHANGQVHYWTMGGGRRLSGADIDAPVAADWTIVGVGDLNGDGTDDILWRTDSGVAHYWPMSAGRRTGGLDIEER